MIKIGNYTQKNPLMMAPMAGCTDLPFRTLIRAYGCPFCFTEMVDAKSLAYKSKRTLRMLETTKKDSPLGVQLLGSDPKILVDAISIVLEHIRPSIIDLNCACPAPKILKKGAGSSLLKYPLKTGKIIKKMVDFTDIPITIKMRLGHDDNDRKQGLKLAKIAQDNGASAVFIHGRTVKQAYSGSVDYEAIKEVKAALNIPLIASGDILSPELAKEMLDKTGCNGLLVARGALGRPWIFREIEVSLLGKKCPPPPSILSIKRVVKRHLKLFKTWKNTPEEFMIGDMRKISVWYFRGKYEARKMRDAINRAKTYREILRIIDRA